MPDAGFLPTQEHLLAVQLMNVQGLGEKNLKKIEPYLSAGETAPKAGATK